MLPPHIADHTTLERNIRALHGAWLRATIASAFRTLFAKTVARVHRPAQTVA